MKPGKRVKRIAFAFPAGISFVERILHGVLEYARQHGGWSFVRLPERLDPSLDWLRTFECDGALIIITNEEDARVARSLPMPVVNLTAYLQVPQLPTVMVDQRETGKMAALHLLERRFTRFGYYGASDLWYSKLRRTSFVETIEAAGGTCKVLEVSSGMHRREKYRRGQERLQRWLKTLKPPVGIMASTDLRASMASDACANVGLRIPEDVALIGVDDDPICEFNFPPLSSVSRNHAELGRTAAMLLDKLMRGGTVPGKPILIPPDKVITRRSTETFAIEDARIARSVDHIQKNVHRPFGVEELLEVAAMPRRTFEQHFLKKVGITAYAFINRCRVEHACHLLTSPTRRSLTEIASMSGFSDLRRFRLVFRRLMGTSPATFMRENSSAGALH